jgi:hypothetical protein
MTGPQMVLKAMGIDLDPVKLKQFAEQDLPQLVVTIREGIAELNMRLARIEQHLGIENNAQKRTN